MTHSGAACRLRHCWPKNCAVKVRTATCYIELRYRKIWFLGVKTANETCLKRRQNLSHSTKSWFLYRHVQYCFCNDLTWHFYRVMMTCHWCCRFCRSGGQSSILGSLANPAGNMGCALLWETWELEAGRPSAVHILWRISVMGSSLLPRMVSRKRWSRGLQDIKLHDLWYLDVQKGIPKFGGRDRPVFQRWHSMVPVPGTSHKQICEKTWHKKLQNLALSSILKIL